MLKLGVLMSVYCGDDPPLLERALESIVSQEGISPGQIRTYLGVDGPIPASLQVVIERYRPSFYKLIFFEHNRGLVHVLNDLIRVREDEEYFFRMDADDVSAPQRFSHQVTYMQTHPDVDILGTDMIEVNTTEGGERIVRFATCPRDARRSIARRVPVAHPTVCFRARVFDRVPQYPEVQLNEDIAMWFACLEAGLIFDNLHEPLYRFTIGPDFWRRRSVLKAWSECLAYTRGIWALDGLTWNYVFPILRLLVRLSPGSVQRLAYSSQFRLRRSIS